MRKQKKKENKIDPLNETLTKKKKPLSTQPSSVKANINSTPINIINQCISDKNKHKRKSHNKQIQPTVYFGSSRCGSFFHVCRGGSQSHIRTSNVRMQANLKQEKKDKQKKTKKKNNKKMNKEFKNNERDDVYSEHEYLSYKKLTDSLNQIECKTVQKSQRQRSSSHRILNQSSRRNSMAILENKRIHQKQNQCRRSRAILNPQTMEYLRQRRGRQAQLKVQSQQKIKQQKKQEIQKKKQKVIKEQKKIVEEVNKKQFFPSRQMIKKAFICSINN